MTKQKTPYVAPPPQTALSVLVPYKDACPSVNVIGCLCRHDGIWTDPSLQSTYHTFSGCKKGWVSPDTPLISLTVSDPSMCAMSCMQTKACLSYNICEDGNKFMCHLIPSIKLGRCSDLETERRCVYMEKQGNPCQNGGTWESSVCACVDGYAGKFCERYIRSCQEGWDLNVRVSKYFMVQPFGSPMAYKLYCNLKYAETTIFLARWKYPGCPNGFDKTWKEYKEGWGDVDCGEYFLGLETIYQLMKYERFQMHVYGKLVTTIQFDYFYSNFTVQSESAKYRMDYVDGFNKHYMLGDDGFGTERPRDFCTQDRDCGSCAVNSEGGWWFSSGCRGHSLTSSDNFVWPVSGTDEEVKEVVLQLAHMDYLFVLKNPLSGRLSSDTLHCHLQ